MKMKMKMKMRKRKRKRKRKKGVKYNSKINIHKIKFNHHC